MDGILIIDKPAGITSHDVVSRVRRILKTKRVGHTGTLDPFATGVMVILVGQTTRLAQFLDKDEKEYEALVRFGFETDTGDLTGVRGEESGVPSDEIGEHLTGTNWEDVFSSFRGEIEQVPPMYSAKKIDGKRLYEHARKGETIERKSIRVHIKELEIVGVQNSENMGAGTWDLRSGTWNMGLRVVCSAGTYIRTLAEDIGRVVGTGAHLEELRRTRAGKFTIEQGLTLERLEALPALASALVPIREAVSHLPVFVVPDERVAKTRNGMSTRVYETAFIDGEPLQMIDAKGSLIGIGYFKADENTVQPKVVLI